MKKFLAIIMATIIMLVVTGCGNMSLGLGEFNFKRIHVDMYHYSGCLTVEKWYENENGIEVKTKEAGNIYLAEGMYALIEEDCPFCN